MHGEDETPDRTLVAAAQAGEGEAFLRLVARYHARLEATLRRDVGDPARAADLAQDAVDAAYDDLHLLRDPEGFYPWLRRIAANRRLKDIRQQRRRHAALDRLRHQAPRAADPLVRVLIREAAAALDALLDAYPDTLLAARANRAFLRRAVAFLAAQGVDRFLDVGSGLPTVGNVHEVARRANPKARVVYVDNDPVAVRYSQELLEEEEVSGVAAIEGDLRDPAAILSRPAVRRLLAARRPLALLLLAVLPLIPADDEARRVVRQLTAALPKGSYLAISHATFEGGAAEALARFARQYEARTSPVAFRPRATIEGFFAGCELVPPGLVFLPAWRPDGTPDPLRDEPGRGQRRRRRPQTVRMGWPVADTVRAAPCGAAGTWSGRGQRRRWRPPRPRWSRRRGPPATPDARSPRC